MRTEWKWGLALAALLAVGAPADGLAQGRWDPDDDRADRSRQVDERDHPSERMRRDRDRDDRNVRDDRDGRRRSRGRIIQRDDLDGVIVLHDRRGRAIVLDRDDFERRRTYRRGNGPPFCRSGHGHPVHGRAWCLEKGWGLGGRDLVFLDNRRVVFWNGREATWVRDFRINDRWSLWTGILNGVLEVARIG